MFVAGDSYLSSGFSTRSGILDRATGVLATSLEDFRIDGRRPPADANFWGVSFAADDNTFYATMSTGSHLYLVQGDFAAETITVLDDGVECPSLSPDGSRLVYKKRLPDQTWQLWVYRLGSRQRTQLAEPANVDDQPALARRRHRDVRKGRPDERRRRRLVGARRRQRRAHPGRRRRRVAGCPGLTFLGCDSDLTSIGSLSYCTSLGSLRSEWDNFFDNWIRCAGSAAPDDNEVVVSRGDLVRPFRPAHILLPVLALAASFAIAIPGPATAATRSSAGIDYRSSSSGSALDVASIAIDRPAGAEVGDLLLARVANREHSGATMTASGWTAAGTTRSGARTKSWIFWRTVTTAEPASYTFTTDAATTLAGTISAFSGVDPLRPVEGFAGRVNGSTTAFTTPRLTTLSGNDVAVWFGTQAFDGASAPTIRSRRRRVSPRPLTTARDSLPA